MKLSLTITPRLLKRKIATIALISASLAAFATLGDGGKKEYKSFTPQSGKLSSKSFSLRSGYNYKANNLLAAPQRQQQYIMLNTTVTYQKGNATYAVPLKKKVLIDKVKFTPSAPIRF